MGDLVKLKRLALTNGVSLKGNLENPQVIQELAKSEFPHLTSLTLPLCYLLEVKENEVSKQVGKKKLRAHNDSIKQTCNKGISLLAQKCPNLSHLEVVGHNHGLPEALPCSFCEVMQGEK